MDEPVLKTYNKKPIRQRSLLKTLSTVLIVAGLLLMLAAGGLFGLARLRYAKQQSINQELATHVVVHDDVVEEEAETEEACPVDVDWAALKAINDDVVGWIYVPGTVINYPVYQGVDNEEYLRTNALGEWTVGGQVFLDFDNTAPGMVDYQSILYGHHLQDGTMFQPLSLLDDQKVFDETETIWYVTEEHAYKMQPLFMYYVAPDDETVRQFKFSDVESFRSYLRKQLSKAVTRRSDADTLVSEANRVLTMSTCNYYDGYGRSILVAIEV